MDKEWKVKWIAALRSGKYKQGKNTLRDNGYCCLGVLCDLVAPEDWVRRNVYVHQNKSNLPSNEVLSKADLSLSKAQRLSGMNDNGSTFAQIADYIEANL